MLHIDYTPSKTIERFMQSTKPIRCLVGTAGCGKTQGAIMELIRKGIEQQAGNDGIRRTRFGIIKKNYSDMENTILNDFKGLIDENLATYVHKSPTTLKLNFSLDDGTLVYITFVFIAIMDAKSASKLKSANLTAVMFNEVDLCPFEAYVMATQRINRYPPVKYGAGITWSGIITDSNAPDQDNWFFDVINNPSDDMEVFYFPAPFIAVNGDLYNLERNPLTENAENLAQPPGYEKMSLAQRRDIGFNKYYRNQLYQVYNKNSYLIKKYLLNISPETMTGEGVYTTYFKHDMVKPTQYKSSERLYIGFDTSGLHPAVVIMQYYNNTIVCLGEFYACNISLVEFCERLVNEINSLVVNLQHHCGIIVYVDKADPKGFYNLMSPSQIVNNYFSDVRLSLTNATDSRINIGYNIMKGNLIIDPRCKMLIKGLQGNYMWDEKARVNGMLSKQQIKKNEYSHIVEAWQYGLLGIMNEYGVYNKIIPNRFGIQRNTKILNITRSVA